MAIIAIVAVLTILPFLAEGYLLYLFNPVDTHPAAHPVSNTGMGLAGLVIFPMIMNIQFLVQSVQKVRKGEAVSVWKLLGLTFINIVIIGPVAYIWSLH